METEKRTAEEILNAIEKSDTDRYFPAYTYEEDYAGGTCKYHRSDLVERAIHDYAAQELDDYKTVIKELIPIAENAPTDYINFGKTKQEAIIERARKLIKL